MADPAQLDDGNTLSIAEAYPAAYDAPPIADEDIPAENEVSQDAIAPLPSEDDAQPLPPKKKVPKEYVPAAADVDDEVKPVESEVIAPSPSNPQKKKKVELEEAAAAAADEEDDYVPFGTKSQRGQWPMHSFFPMNFGSTSGGAIAVANSFSTGKGGTATSHATAYGSPATTKDKKRRLTQQ